MCEGSIRLGTEMSLTCLLVCVDRKHVVYCTQMWSYRTECSDLPTSLKPCARFNIEGYQYAIVKTKTT